MRNAIYLLAGEAESPHLTAMLRRHDPQLDVFPALTVADLPAPESGKLDHARLVAFLFPEIVPSAVLKAAGRGAYNVHPGTPDYPGWAPTFFAWRDRATVFGSTLHVMTETADAGPIVDMEIFEIPPGIRFAALEELTYGASARLFLRTAKALATQFEALPTVSTQWTGKRRTKRQYAAMCGVAADNPRPH